MQQARKMRNRLKSTRKMDNSPQLTRKARKVLEAEEAGVDWWKEDTTDEEEYEEEWE
jgi:hypothetical protein